jgi:membrane-bound inhibitor of C-type lysozyme
MSPVRLGGALLVAVALAGCVDNPSKEEQEAAKNTIVCQLHGERVVIRFDAGEVRILLGGDRITLYQVPSASGVRFSNGNLELRGKDLEFTLLDFTNATQAQLVECAPYTLPKQ